MKTLKEYFDNVNAVSLIYNLFELYPSEEKNMDGYVQTLDIIGSIEPVEPKPTMRINVSRYKQTYRPEYDMEDDNYIHISGIDPEAEDDEYGTAGKDITWSLSFTPWEEWLAMDVEVIDPSDEDLNTDEKILAHIIWEMSWHGYDQETIKEEEDEIKARMKDLEEILAHNTHEEAVEKGLLFEWDYDKIIKDSEYEN